MRIYKVVIRIDADDQVKALHELLNVITQANNKQTDVSKAYKHLKEKFAYIDISQETYDPLPGEVDPETGKLIPEPKHKHIFNQNKEFKKALSQPKKNDRKNS